MLLQPFSPLLPHLEGQFLYLVPGPNQRTVRCSGEPHVILTLVYKDVSSYYQSIQSDAVSLANGLLRVLGEGKLI